MKKTIEKLKQKVKGYFADVGAFRIEVSYSLEEEAYLYKVQEKYLVKGADSIFSVTDWDTIYSTKLLEEAMSIIEKKKHLRVKNECENAKTYMYF